jgi:hypothetical protein
MINHARTLLLNIPAQRGQLQDQGYEYIPEEFVPVQLTPALATIRRVLFGARPDVYFLTARAQELLGYVHNTELAARVYALDSRVTYWPATTSTFFENAKPTVTVRQTYGPPLRLITTGSFFADSAAGRSTADYTVVLNNETGLELAVQRAGAASAEITAIANTSNPPIVSLPTTEVTIRPDFSSAVSAVTRAVELAGLAINEQFDVPLTGWPVSPPTGAAIVRWLISARANPKPAITSLLPILELLGEPLFLELFGVAPAEPYLTLKNLWFDHPIPAYRLAGLTLAVIYRTEEIRNSSNV